MATWCAIVTCPFYPWPHGEPAWLTWPKFNLNKGSGATGSPFQVDLTGAYVDSWDGAFYLPALSDCPIV